jgi:hypothetical protein
VANCLVVLTCGNVGRDGGIRTHDPLTPSTVKGSARDGRPAIRPGYRLGRRRSYLAFDGPSSKIVSQVSPKNDHRPCSRG